MIININNSLLIKTKNKMVFKWEINLDLWDAQDSTENESKESKENVELKTDDKNTSENTQEFLQDEKQLEAAESVQAVEESQDTFVEETPKSDFAVMTQEQSEPKKNEFTLWVQDEEPEAQPINIDLLPKFKIGETESKPQKEEAKQPVKNDFSMNLWWTGSTLNSKWPIIDAANLLPDDLEEDVKVEKKEKVKKEVAQPDVITNIAEWWIKVSEDIELAALTDMLNKNMLGKQKRKKVLIYAWISILAFSILGGLGFLVFLNKDTILKNFAANILPEWEKTIVKEKVVEVIVDKDELEAQNYTWVVAIVNRDAFKNLEVEDFYKIYKTDFLFIDQANISDKDKKNVLTKLNLLVYSYNKWDINYPLFRIKYNNLISNMLRMERINQINNNKPANQWDQINQWEQTDQWQQVDQWQQMEEVQEEQIEG